jgi:hypothetical protein
VIVDGLAIRAEAGHEDRPVARCQRHEHGADASVRDHHACAPRVLDDGFERHELEAFGPARPDCRVAALDHERLVDVHLLEGGQQPVEGCVVRPNRDEDHRPKTLPT